MSFETNPHFARIPVGASHLDAWVVPSELRHAATVVVLHDHFGLTAAVRRWAQYLGELGYDVVVPDLHRSVGSRVALSERDPDQRQIAEDLLRRFDAPAALADLEVVLESIRVRRGDVPVAAVGFGLGGTLATLLGAHGHVDTVVAYYPLRLRRHATDLVATRVPTLVHLATHDEWTPPAEQAAFRRDVEENVRVLVESYPAERHRFAAEDSPWYQDLRARSARSTSLAFLDVTLGPSARLGADDSNRSRPPAHELASPAWGG